MRTDRVILPVKVAAAAVAFNVISLLVYNFNFNDYTAIALGVVSYIVAKALFGILVGYVLGKQDARELKQYIAQLPPDIRQDILDQAPRDAKKTLSNRRTDKR